MADIGVAPHIIETVLNHISGHKRGVAGVYNQSRYEGEVQNALAAWARRLELIVDDGLRAAHEAFLANGDDKEARKAFFNAAIISGAGRWERYLKMIVDGKAGNVIEMRSNPIPA
jgi:hypothetical protein